ncbi:MULTISPECIES: 50S ribosomal protein L35 [Helicobacter]|uniref:Large ribosomal subunit protein bL35 n=1 Tax=Helicobacter ganmani TaxID=60246 RepID=A0A3D8IF82_9HELI|nr:MULTISPECIES: 50S ribosomal protein L35 [Helicobacter]RDU63780.1 50S ribosomal protein L35 [Helicobacter ganmani]
MPKMKTNRGAAKRFKLKKNLIKRGSAFKSHILTKKRPRKIASLNAPKYVHDANIEQVKKLLCMA